LIELRLSSDIGDKAGIKERVASRLARLERPKHANKPSVDLPVSTAKPQPRSDKPLFLTTKSDLSLAVGNETVTRADLARTLDRATTATVAEEMPHLEPAPSVPEPAVQLPEQQPDKNEKPQEKVDDKVAHEDSLQANAAPMTTAPPPSEAKPSDARGRTGARVVSHRCETAGRGRSLPTSIATSATPRKTRP
jgi:hypothetical protein